MSTQPIVIQITDQIDPSIVVKINGIGTAARSAATDVNSLQTAIGRLAPVIAGINGQFGNMAQTVNNVVQPLKQATQGVSGLESGIAQLLARGVAAEAGMGRLGGALARVGVSAAGAGPFIIAALAIGAVVSAILIYQRFEEAARKLTDSQIALNDQEAKQNDKLLTLHETLIGLTEGPLAKYQAQLNDLSKRSLDVDVSKIDKVLDDQKSHWADLVAVIQRYVTLQNAANLINGTPQAISANQPTFDIQDAQDFIRQQEAVRTNLQATQQDLKKFVEQVANTAQTVEQQQQAIARFIESAAKSATPPRDNLKLLQDDLSSTLQKIVELRQLQATQDDGRNRQATTVAIQGLSDYYDELLGKEREYYGSKAILEKGANGETLAEQKRAAAEQLRFFNEELDQLKQSGHLVNAQEELQLRQSQLGGIPRPTALGPTASQAPVQSTALIPGNVPVLQHDIAQLTQEIAKQGETVDQVLRKYQVSIGTQGAYSEQLKAQAEIEKRLTEIEGRRIPITDEIRKRVTDAVSVGQAEVAVNREKALIYNQLEGPTNKYAAAIKGINELVKEHAINEQQAAQATAQAQRAYEDATHPLAEYAHGLQNQIQLVDLYGNALTAATSVQSINENLRQRGLKLTDQQAASIGSLVVQIQHLKQVQSEENQLWEATTGQLDKLGERWQALNKAYSDNVVSTGLFRSEALKTALAFNELTNAMDGGNLKSNVLQVFGQLIPLFTSMQNVGHQVSQNLVKDFGQFFSTLEKGFANAIAQSLVYGKSLSQGLLDAARQAVAGLISSLIELGIQYLIVIALQKAFGITLPKQTDQTKQQVEQAAIAIGAIAAITAVQLAAINILTEPAWALAEAVSLFSFGANAVPAEAGIAAVVAAGTAASAAGKFAQGGIVQGTPGIDKIPAWLTDGEFVVNAGATKQHRDVLEQINSNATSVLTNNTNTNSTAISHFGGTTKQSAWNLANATTNLYQGINITSAKAGIEAVVAQSSNHARLYYGGYVSRFAEGGYVTHANVDAIPSWLADIAITADLASRSKSAIASVTSGANAVRANGGASAAAGPQPKLNINIMHDGSTNVHVEQIDESTVRVIAKQEARSAVEQHAPKAVANDLFNPNGHTSKAMNRNYTAPRKR